MLLFACACLPGVLLRDLCLEVPVGRVTHFALSEKRFRTLLLCLLAPPPQRRDSLGEGIDSEKGGARRAGADFGPTRLHVTSSRWCGL